MSPMTAEALALSGELARELGQMPILGDWKIGVPYDCEFIVYSRSRAVRAYPMVYTPEGYAVHQGEGCEGEIFHGPLGCWHSKEYSK